MQEVCRIRRVVWEALDVTFYICNNYTESFGFSKIFDMVDQILPSAFVLNTGYWPFYCNPIGNCPCVCGRYGIFCRHIRNQTHWINLKAVDNITQDNYFKPAFCGTIRPFLQKVFVKRADTTSNFIYNIDIDLYLKNEISPDEMILGLDYVLPKEFLTGTLKAKYVLQLESYPSPFEKIFFSANPKNLKNYGMYLPEIRQKFSKWDNLEQDESNHPHVVNSATSRYSLILNKCNVPYYRIGNVTNMSLLDERLHFTKVEPLKTCTERYEPRDKGNLSKVAAESKVCNVLNYQNCSSAEAPFYLLSKDIPHTQNPILGESEIQIFNTFGGFKCGIVPEEIIDLVDDK